ncbi:MAG: UDP-N-acetylmuramate dehydrogenase [Actinomycetota bacterium]|nr:UDP-N-acetylmuramate dehydrogenase [Actinomycetota bacterium]
MTPAAASVGLMGMVQEHVLLGPRTTYKMGGPARYLAEVPDEAALLRLADALSGSSPAGDSLPVLVLGRGSNLLVSDDGFPGLVVLLGKAFAHVEVAEDDSVLAGGAASLPVVARTAGEAGRGGLEFLVGIPGSVGGGVRMNAGCHGAEVVDRLRSARVVSLLSGRVTEREAGGLDLAYRHSNLAPHEVVTRARFAAHPRSPAQSRELIREITRWRRDNQPGGTLNAGSVFRNPPGDAAGRLIDSLGLKGFRVGRASVSEKHGNFFIADRHASAQDVYDLVWAVRRRVGEEAGVWLEPEVQFAGPFRPSADRQAGPP